MKLFHGTSYANYKSILKDKYIKYLEWHNVNHSNAKTNGLDEIFNYSEADIDKISLVDNKDTARQFGLYSAMACKKRGEQDNYDFVVLTLDSQTLNKNHIQTHPVDCLSGYEGLEYIIIKKFIPVYLIEDVDSIR